MTSPIAAALGRTRAVLVVFAALVAAGVVAYQSIPREANPEVVLPRIQVSASLAGATPTDVERLLITPLEIRLGGLDGIERIRATAAEGRGTLVLAFRPGADPREALARVRDAVAHARPELPAATDDLVVRESAAALAPILYVALSGPVPRRERKRLAEELMEAARGVPGVLSASAQGLPDEILEVLVDPARLRFHGLSVADFVDRIAANNRMVAAGTVQAPAGDFPLSVPGFLTDVGDMAGVPLAVADDRVLPLGDVARLRRTFEDTQSVSRVDGQPAIIVAVTKRPGANVVETVRGARAAIDRAAAGWPETMEVTYVFDASTTVADFLSGLRSNIIAAIALVMICVIAVLGLRAGALVGLSIPASFLIGILGLALLGQTLNTVVLFSLILVVGLLVDGAIVVVEQADREMAAGAAPRAAFDGAARAMTWPVISGTATTLSVFVPLLFWPGVIGQQLEALPMTVVVVLTAALFVALLLVPAVGGWIGRRRPRTAAEREWMRLCESGDPRRARGAAGVYGRLLGWCVLRPWTVIALAAAALACAVLAYGQHGAGITFFPSVEPRTITVEIRSEEGFSFRDRDELVRLVEARLADLPGVEAALATTLGPGGEAFGRIVLVLAPWDRRPPATEIGGRIRAAAAGIPGIAIVVDDGRGTPSGGAPVKLEVSGRDRTAVDAAVDEARALMAGMDRLTDVRDSRAIPGLEWHLAIDRAEAAREGVDLPTLERNLQLLTRGVTVGTFRPADVVEPMDIRVRFVPERRTLEQLRVHRVATGEEAVPLAGFVEIAPRPRSGAIQRVDQRRVVTVEAGVAPGAQVFETIAALREALSAADLPPGVSWRFGGQAEEQDEQARFLVGAFVAALLAMFTVLLVQFDSFRQVFVVMSAIVFSTAGVLVALLVTGRPFGLVMTGVGTIALAGIVVNNNIVLIDRFNALRRRGMAAREAALRAGAQRLRPVLLTTVTTVAGLMPMALGLEIDILGREIVPGAPFTQYWTDLSTAIAGGLALATLPTLLVTPAMLALAAPTPRTRGMPKADERAGVSRRPRAEDATVR